MTNIKTSYKKSADKRKDWERMWHEKYLLLVEHKRIFGHMKVVDIYDTWELTLKFKGLKKWVFRQRTKAKNGTLQDYRQQLLMNIDFCFDPELEHWLENYKKLSDYKNEFGSCVINFKNEEYRTLFGWLFHQRQHRENLTPFQISKLDELGFNWMRKDERWLSSVDKLKEYKRIHGNLNVPEVHKGKTYTPEFKKLSRFVMFQRKQFNKGRLQFDRYKILLELGFEFDPIQRNWERNLEGLLKYKEEYGNCNVPDKWKKNLPLSSWVESQRADKETLPPERLKILNEVGFIWDVRAYNFQQNYEQLKQFKDIHGHLKVPRKENPRLFQWINTTRVAGRGKNGCILTENQIAKLDELAFDWEPGETIWQAGYSSLLEFKSKFNHCDVKYTREGRKLWRWVVKQRKDKHILSLEKKKMLDDIGFIWD